jgi:hypothetical protein
MNEDLVARVDLDTIEVNVRVEVVMRRLQVDRARDLNPPAHDEPCASGGDHNAREYPSHTIHQVNP